MTTPPLTLLAASALLSALVTWLIVRFPSWHLAMSADAAAGVQKFHANVTPRIGGLPIALAFVATSGMALSFAEASPHARALGPMLLTAVPVFLIGLMEDLTKRVGPAARLAVMALAAMVATTILEVRISTLDLPAVDRLLEIGAVSTAFTVLAMVGVSNAFNIIDGYNGLMGTVSIIVLTALGVVAWVVGDQHVMLAAFALAGSLFGFLAWNYPNGRIFAGDGGSYFVGFLIALLSIMLVERNDAVSPWFPLALVIYPVWETVFSIYRRRILQGVSATQPDALHLHTLVYRRLCRLGVLSKDARVRTRRNALTSPYLWLLSCVAVLPAVLFWRNTTALQTVVLGFVVVYLVLYRRIVRFHTPRWLVLGERERGRKSPSSVVAQG
jgi:UDP-N-acetylmuramyl pentapeptide phosphotransferase/UDP-N-acetylglucosamine-1-phosphate transferase